MAVIDKKNVAKTQSDTTETTTESTKGRIVDVLQDKSLPTGEKRKIDTTEDAWAFSAPPKAGRYSIKLFLAKDGVTCFDKDPTKEPGYSVAIEGKIVNSQGGEFDNVTVFPRVVTFFGRGKNISTAAGLIDKLGYKVPNEADQLEIAKLLVLALKKEPVIDVELDWQGWSKLESRVVYKGMHAFPHDEQGEPMHIVEYKSSKGLEEINAQAQVVHWYKKGEQSKVSKGSTNSGSRNIVTLRPAADEDEGTTAIQEQVTQAKGTPAPTNDEDLASMLELQD